jgi:hypothetical protein
MNSTYVSLQREISERFCAARSNPVAFLRILTEEDSSSRLLDDLVAEVLSTNTIRDELALKSYVHDNSFTKITLWEDIPNRLRLRLHWWEAVERDGSSSNIHNHRFNCVSRVLRGRLQNAVWGEEGCGESRSHYQYYPRAQSEQYHMKYVGQSELNVTSKDIFCAKQLYALDSRVLHTSQCLEADTITLFLEDRSVLHDFADVFSLRYERNDIVVSSPSMQPNALADSLSRIAALLFR